MQDIARQMLLPKLLLNLNRRGIGKAAPGAPDAEVDLCGHATLAGAHVSWDEGYLGRMTARSSSPKADTHGDA